MGTSKHVVIGVLRGLAFSALLAVACAPSAPGPSATAPSQPATQRPAGQATAQTPAATQASSVAPTGAPAASKTAAPAAKPSGEVVYVAPDLGAERWDPTFGSMLLNTNGFGYAGPVFETLYQHMPPNAQVKPFLLDSGTVSQDGMTWTLKLRDGIRFSNRDPMTADDVKFSLDRFRSPESTSTNSALFRQKIKDVQVVDRLTTQVSLLKPFPTLPIFLAGRTGNEGIVMPKKYVEQVGWDELGKHPIGSGPYKVVDQKIGQSITYGANENYWRSTPTYATIRNLMVPEEQTRIAMLQAGQADMIKITPQTKQQVEKAGFKTLVVPYMTMWRIHFYGDYGNYPDNPLMKLEVRKALTLALNKQEMLNGLYAGAGEVASYAQSAPGFTLGAPKLPPTPYDPAEAKRLLQQAGYPNGFNLPLWAPNAGCSTSETQQFAQAVAGYWGQIGVKAEIKPIDWATTMRAKISPQLSPDMVGSVSTFCTGAGPTADRDLGIFWHSTESFKLANAADAEIEKAQAALSTEELVRATEAAYQKIYDNYQNIGVFQGGVVLAVSNKLADYPVTAGVDNMMAWLVKDRP